MTATDHHNALGLALLGGTLATATTLLWGSGRAKPSGRKEHVTAIDTMIDDATWIYPVPNLVGLGDVRRATTSNPFRPQPSSDGSRREHLGVDLMYKRRDARDLIAAYPVGTPGGSPMFVMPEHVPALAASAGVVTFAGMTPKGYSVIVRHLNGWATYYTHLATLAVERDAWIRAGQTLGTIGASPEDPAGLRHLHVELWPDAKRERAVDPDLHLAAWSRVTRTWPLAANVDGAIASSLKPRNGTLSAYRPVGESGDAYPEWVRRLRGQSGVYVIREIDGPIVYVGSSVGRLYETLTRHLQTWRRWKGYWRGQFGEGADPGLTYPRHSVEVAIKTTTPDDAHEEEMRMIRRLQPRDNQLGQPELDEAPF